MEMFLDLPGVLALLEEGHTVLLPTPEAAFSVRERHRLAQTARGCRAWEAPALLSWGQWIDSIWHDLVLQGFDQRTLLNRLQEEWVWRQVASSAGVDAGMGSAAQNLAGQARSAQTLASDYRILDRLHAMADSADSRTFAAWQKRFAKRLETEDLLARASLPEVLLEHLHAGRWAPTHDLHLVGFDKLTPSQTHLIEALRSHGHQVEIHELRSDKSGDVPGCTDTQGCLTIDGDPEAEARWAVRWTREFLSQQPASEAGPAKTVAIVLPDPEAERMVLEPLLREMLAPELESIAVDLSSTPWHFSMAPALGKGAILAHALDWLRWLGDELSLDSISRLLLSPYLSHAETFEQRARFDLHVLRRSGVLRPEMTLSGFLQWAQLQRSKTEEDLPSFQFPEWNNLLRLAARPLRSAATFGEWAGQVRQWLQHAGWPGTRTLSPAEFSFTELWDHVLDQIGTLDLFGTQASYGDFLDLLTAELQQVTSQGGNKAVPVHLLRASETEGRLFDAVLVLRATDAFWPMPQTAHPLLGWELQRSAGLPGTDAGDAQRRSLALLRGWQTRCSTLLLTTASHDANGPLRLTRLAKELDLFPYAAETLLAPETPRVQTPTERIAESEPLPPLPSPQISGGARVLELQAKCGFRAFATLRLQAGAPEQPELGCDAREAGQDLHKVLELFWRSVPSRAALVALSMAERRAAVSKAVTETLRLRRAFAAGADAWSGAYLQVLEERLTAVVLRWLEEELRRDAFTVLTQEQKQLVAVGPLELSIRPDRIDAVEGGYVFVDYKTSSGLSTRNWLGERPDAPQLPLYALLAEPDTVKGIAFGQVRPGKDMGWVSLQADPGIFPRKTGISTEDLSGLVEMWRTELARLASEFADGKAMINPKVYPHTCQYCQQRLLCRLDATTLLASGLPSSEQVDTMEGNDPAS